MQLPEPRCVYLAAGSTRAASPSARPVSIGYVGRIHPEKGLETLLEAAARLAARSDLPAWRVPLIGPASVAHGGGGEAYRAQL